MIVSGLITVGFSVQPDRAQMESRGIKEAHLVIAL
jgi:hypothetical protein